MLPQHYLCYIIIKEDILQKKKSKPKPNLIFKILQARPEVCSSMKLDTELHLTNSLALEILLLVLGKSMKLQQFGRERDGISVTVSCPL